MERKLAVLVVEDDSVIRGILKEVLESDRIFVYEAGSCAQTMQCLAERRIDAVVLDNGLPDGKGIRLLPRILERCSRVIMVTADEDSLREEALASGAEAIFPKPFDDDKLRACLLNGFTISR